MRRWGRGLLAALALVVLANAIALSGVAWNRRGAPDATVILTERELKLPRNAGDDEDDTGLALELEWNPRWDSGKAAPELIPAATLHELGFELSPLRQEPERTAWVVLEMEGKAWSRWLAKRREGDCPPRTVSTSRLVAVDAGVSREALRRRHPDRSRFVIVPGVVRETGVVPELRVESIHVPLRLRPVLDEIAKTERLRGARAEEWPRPPRYRTTVAFGQRGEPWLVGVEKLPEPVSRPAGSASAPPPAPPDGCSG
jgi:hypothetical protein